jgi:hypothetical protein
VFFGFFSTYYAGLRYSDPSYISPGTRTYDLIDSVAAANYFSVNDNGQNISGHYPDPYGHWNNYYWQENQVNLNADSWWQTQYYYSIDYWCGQMGTMNIYVKDLNPSIKITEYEGGTTDLNFAPVWRTCSSAPSLISFSASTGDGSGYDTNNTAATALPTTSFTDGDYVVFSGGSGLFAGANDGYRYKVKNSGGGLQIFKVDADYPASPQTLGTVSSFLLYNWSRYFNVSDRALQLRSASIWLTWYQYYWAQKKAAGCILSSTLPDVVPYNYSAIDCILPAYGYTPQSTFVVANKSPIP